MSDRFSTLLEVIGLAVIAAGVALVSVPAAMIAVGTAVFAAGYLGVEQ